LEKLVRIVADPICSKEAKKIERPSHNFASAIVPFASIHPIYHHLNTHSMSSPTTVTGSLTPLSRADATVAEASAEGFWNGLLTLIPSTTAVALLVRNSPYFVTRTNWQSRTAMAIMPAMFVAALTSEMKLSHRMREIAVETQHGHATVQWAEQELQQQQQQTKSHLSETQQLAALYQKSVEHSGVCIVKGDRLQWYHQFANYTQEYPFRVLAAVAVPAVGYIFYGRTEQAHLPLSQKIMHTRVFGQFATISLLLGVMGFKEFMDRNGKFISQEDADDRVAEMHQLRARFMSKVALEKQHAAEWKEALAEAHAADVALEYPKKKKKSQKHKMISAQVTPKVEPPVVDVQGLTSDASSAP
jgi:hypothetical protein